MKMDELCYIEWVDSRGTHGSWTELSSMDTSYCIINSVGFILKETDDLIHLVPHVSYDSDQGCGDMVIPKVCITKRESFYVREYNYGAG